MIDFADHAVHAIVERRHHRSVWAFRATVVSGQTSSECSGDIRLWPELQQGRGHGIRSAAVGGNLSGVRHAVEAHRPSPFALAFVVGIEKGFVMDDRSPERSAKLVVVK